MGIYEKYEKFDELDNIVNTLDILTGEITDKYYKDILEETKTEAFSEREDLQKELEELEENEKREMNYEFERSRL